MELYNVAQVARKNGVLHSKSNQLPHFAVENMALHLVRAGKAFTTCCVESVFTLSAKTSRGLGIFTDLALLHRQKGISWLGLMIGWRR